MAHRARLIRCSSRRCVDIVDGHVVLDETQSTKQPDWSHEPVDSARWPAAYLADTSVQVGPPAKAAASPLDRDGRPVEIDVRRWQPLSTLPFDDACCRRRSHDLELNAPGVGVRPAVRCS